ncbi:ATP-binding protein [Pseudoduganella umbonata]|uniref:histidine kinase n=1 Tax=Pseudoduganella umbonata TaxID=864828 RepID=A0A4P8HZR8_9BURK|nr:ATP-binding protein [Pseudoduganella umbonata]MBB3224185.1 signal transduction histidine kinase/predicted negative regulator of RcsB-dependent stress response [Pseudoduganella umbonata]QCP13955.1 tetratricopeptide repeat protein [Pseudoduganella umbonata]
MDLFASDDAIAQWELALPGLTGSARLPVLVPLAWHLRQRDTGRAGALADEAEALLPEADTAARGTFAARLQLLRAEIRWLAGELDRARSMAEAARDASCAAGDMAGCADAHWLCAWIAVDRGDHACRDRELERCAAAAQGAAHVPGNADRVAIAEAASARWAVLRDLDSARARWGEHFAPDVARPPALECWIHDFLGMAASQSSDFAGAAHHYMRTYEAALATGQVRTAIIAATNIGEKFSNLNDHHAALEWMQRALDTARPKGWPRSTAAALLHTGDTLRRLGRLDAAGELLREALDLLQPYANSRLYAIALQYTGDLCLAQRDYQGALAAFEQLSLRADALEQADFRMVARRGCAHALCFLDRPAEALSLAQEAVGLAAGHHNLYNQVAGLRVLALIHGRHALPGPGDMRESSPALHYLRQALQVAATIDGYIVPGDLHDALAEEYARVGDYCEAYMTARAASAAREKTHSQEATRRAIAMQLHRQTEKARAEERHHRALAVSEAERAELQQQTSAILHRLSAIGREITMHLDAGGIYDVLNRYVHTLLPAYAFTIVLRTADDGALALAFGSEAGTALAPFTIAPDDGTAWHLRCVSERREIAVDDLAQHTPAMDACAQCASALFAPLLLGERVLGAMSVQARQRAAYGERERLIFRTLCAYGAIALDNAQAYRHLQEAQSQLAAQEKLAALGALMAGVAHELNTPIGNSLLIASTLEQRTLELENALNGPGLRRSELAAYIDDARKASELVMRGLHSAADLVASFKQVAVDRTTEQRRRFQLHQVTHEIVATMMNRIRASSHRIGFEVPEGIELDSYPGPFGQVITNFINNALLHAFDGRTGGTMRLTASAGPDGKVAIVFEDDGAGIAPQHLSRIFDPFFTTRLGRGGSGLGLSISYNIVTGLLGGQIAVASSGAGTVFTVELPLLAPDTDPARQPPIY